MTEAEKQAATLEERISEWAEQGSPPYTLGEAEHLFIRFMRAARQAGVGYGWMRQIIEWEWQSKGECAHGPERFEEQALANVAIDAKRVGPSFVTYEGRPVPIDPEPCAIKHFEIDRPYVVTVDGQLYVIRHGMRYALTAHPVSEVLPR